MISRICFHVMAVAMQDWMLEGLVLEILVLPVVIL